MKATIVSTEEWDWHGLYVDGVLMLEGHRLDPFDVARCLCNSVTQLTTSFDGRYPLKLSNLPVNK